MRSGRRALAVTGLSVALSATALAPAAASSGPVGGGSAGSGQVPPDLSPSSTAFRDPDLPNPLAEKQSALREKALHQVLRGKAEVQNINGSKVVKLGQGPEGAQEKAAENGRKAKKTRVQPPRGRQAGDEKKQKKSQYVELAREDTDKIFSILVEFGNKRHPDYPDLKPDNRENPAKTFDGPLHNQIEKPERYKNNVTIWQPDFDREHYQDLYFGDGSHSLKSYYEKQSSGRYSVKGHVTSWVKVPYNEARYGRNVAYNDQGEAVCEATICSNVWYLIRDAVKSWVEKQRAAGKSAAQIKQMLQEYDKWDRYDYDGDGNFNEPDGYIDHFQIIHAGEDEATGGGAQGADAIWSHRWFAFGTGGGNRGPEQNPIGGTEIGNTGIWVGDYTMQPENGALGVFAHEYGHDLGLPDLYDTTGKVDNSVAFWGLMASGSYLGAGDEAIGTVPGDMLTWSKLQLGWLNYETTYPRQKEKVKLGPAEYNTKNPQASVVVLPEKKKTLQLAKPPQGKKAWWSTRGDNLKTSMTREVKLPQDPATLSFQTWYHIEEGYDYAYVQASADGGESWTDLAEPITGKSDGWQQVSLDLDKWSGQTIKLRIRYVTDGAVVKPGILVDDITVTAGGSTVFQGGAESGSNGWKLDGFTATTGTEVSYHPTYYLAENREYISYDKGLKTGPYNFGFPQTRPNFVEHFPYQDGLLVSYWDSSWTNNNVSAHPGHGLILPIDAHPRPIKAPKGYWRTRIQAYDATFGLQPAQGFILHQNNRADRVRRKPSVSLFDDRDKYWYASNPQSGVKTPGTGAKIRVLKEKGDKVKIRVNTKKVHY